MAMNRREAMKLMAGAVVAPMLPKPPAAAAATARTEIEAGGRYVYRWEAWGPDGASILRFAFASSSPDVAVLPLGEMPPGMKCECLVTGPDGAARSLILAANSGPADSWWPPPPPVDPPRLAAARAAPAWSPPRLAGLLRGRIVGLAT